jgi:hypothetical protein
MSAADRLLAACRVPLALQPRQLGLWEIRRFDVADLESEVARAFVTHQVGWPTYTMLARTTIATIERDMGEVVMEDSQRELRRHLPILLAAHGRVLVSGLGLGCVVRGLLSKPGVRHIDVVEIDPTILALVGDEFRCNRRVTLHLGDAESYDWPRAWRWDFAWHDVWTEPDTEHLDVLHARLLARFRDRVTHQGAWQMAA